MNTSRRIKRTPVSSAVQAATTALIISAALPTVASAQLEEIIVTASKRAENLQDVAVSVIALDAQTLNDVGITNFDDYVRYQPNLTASGRGPGNSTFYIRGMATDQATLSAVEAAGNSPNVALYLDEQPIQTIGRNLDVYIADMERIEVLAGPQGTLFGASSQAGTVRLITKKPVLDEFQAGAKFSVSDTKSGEMSTSVEGYINLPLIEDKLAWRTVVYSANQGGFIDNVAGSDDPLLNNAARIASLPGAVTIPAVNTALAEKDFNDADYQGVRTALKFQANDDWDFLFQVMQQQLNTEGTFAQDPTVGELQVSTFFPDFQNDEFSQVAWTVNGHVGNLDLTYTGAFLDRNVDQSTSDNAYLEVGGFIPFYLCDAAQCFDPVYGERFTVETERTTHEFRVATDPENRLRFIGGLFLDDADLGASIDFTSPGQIARGITAQQEPLPGTTIFNPNPRAQGVNFVNDITRYEKQTALFGELTYDLVPDTLSATIGVRYYEQEVSLAGSTNFFFATTDTDNDYGINIDQNLAGISPGKEDDTIIKVNVSWTPNDDALLYATYSEGFRPGGFNRRGGPGSADPTVFVPFGYTTDTVENIEFGWKASFLDNRLRWNGTFYNVDWSDVQLTVTDFTVSNLTFTTNLGEAEVTGIDSDIAFAVNDNFTLFASFAWNDSKMTSISNDIFAPSNVAPVGSSLAFSPELQYTLRGRYTWEAGEYDAHAQLALQHADESDNSIILSQVADIPSWDSLDATIGFGEDNYGVELFIDNLTDERIIRYVRAGGATPEQFVTRPRSIGLRFRYDY
ncbi:MAG: TonB-dependent receptor [Woeseia sp.]|nr:TonB-dependent receptor [Woeseia sp.]